MASSHPLVSEVSWNFEAMVAQSWGALQRRWWEGDRLFFVQSHWNGEHAFVHEIPSGGNISGFTPHGEDCAHFRQTQERDKYPSIKLKKSLVSLPIAHGYLSKTCKKGRRKYHSYLKEHWRTNWAPPWQNLSKHKVPQSPCGMPRVRGPSQPRLP